MMEYVKIAFLLIVFFVLGIFFSTKSVIEEIKIYNSSITDFVSSKDIDVPAIDENGNGIMTHLNIIVRKGDGRILVNINKLLFKMDIQNSIRMAKKIAENYTGINISSYDFVYTIETNATSVEGPSAGAALALLTIAAITGKRINDSVTITGALNHDGTIGMVSNVIEKAKTAKKYGKKLILVPINQGEERKYISRKYCEKIGNSSICTVEKVPEIVNIKKKVGINFVEIKDIGEAIKYVLY